MRTLHSKIMKMKQKNRGPQQRPLTHIHIWIAKRNKNMKLCIIINWYTKQTISFDDVRVMCLSNNIIIFFLFFVSLLYKTPMLDDGTLTFMIFNFFFGLFSFFFLFYIFEMIKNEKEKKVILKNPTNFEQSVTKIRLNFSTLLYPLDTPTLRWWIEEKSCTGTI